MMAQASQLLLLLLLFMGSQGQDSVVQFQKGQTFRVSCRYTPQRNEKRWKIWCKLQENGQCKKLITRNSKSIEHSDLRASLEDNTNTGIITITMSDLRMKDSGIYYCGIHRSGSNTIDVISIIRLEFSPATTMKTTIHPQTTIDSPLTTSAIPLDTSSPRHNQKFIIWGFVLASLLLLGLLSAGIVYTVKISRKPRTDNGKIWVPERNVCIITGRENQHEEEEAQALEIQEKET
ncbi:natural cytotoxicity triggering receptor 2-like isoform X3 [Macrotis lagotis]|uniref:natural cytotoxicity triggering receptor 2-like isoform X3 n=1 Tax=Macrotis lagotis TaxID=92651 RepID=UPI003D69A93B